MNNKKGESQKINPKKKEYKLVYPFVFKKIILRFLK
jgi:hypothetical protein